MISLLMKRLFFSIVARRVARHLWSRFGPRVRAGGGKRYGATRRTTSAASPSTSARPSQRGAGFVDGHASTR